MLSLLSVLNERRASVICCATLEDTHILKRGHTIFKGVKNILTITMIYCIKISGGKCV